MLYGAGLRISEALRLTFADVDLTTAVLHIRESKFYKTRLVPIGPDLTRILNSVCRRTTTADHATPASPFFVSRRGRRGNSERCREGVLPAPRPRRHRTLRRQPEHQPRLHDLRVTFAVHRLVSWYRSGADLQRLLPQLSTYLGHINVQGTQRYLALTPELLREASDRFERYAMGPSHE